MQRLQWTTKESAANAMPYMTLPAGSQDYITPQSIQAIPRFVTFADEVLIGRHAVCRHSHPLTSLIMFAKPTNLTPPGSQ